MIPPGQSGDFVARMEHVLDVYKRPYDPKRPVVCMDESPRQLIRDTRKSLPVRPGTVARSDFEYKRCGVCNLFIAVEPLAGKRTTKVTERRTRKDWAAFVKEIADQYPGAEKITLVMDNLNTHSPGSFYEAYPPHQAKKIWSRFEFVYTPKHGSWLNMAEIELGVLIRQCLTRRIDSISEMRAEVATWQKCRDNRNATIDWQFTTRDARIKLKKLYPTVNA